MRQSPRSRLILSMLVGLWACTPTVNPDRINPTSTSQSGSQSEPQSEPETKAPTTDRAEIADSKTAPPEELSDDLCGNMATQQEMNSCAQESYQQADKQLNSLYQNIRQDLPASGQQALSAAEMAWIEYRDRNCTFAKNQFAGGSIAPLIYNSCLEDHTEARIAELQQPQLPQVSYQAADARLNDTYQTLLAVLTEPEIEDITDIQLAWIEYRDRNCAFEIIHGADVIEESQCLARMSEARTMQLEQDIDQRSL